MHKLSILLLLIFALSFVGCQEEGVIPKPVNLIAEETYLKLLVEFQLLDALIYTSEDSTHNDSLRFELFEHYHVTENQFQTSHTYYQSNVDDQIIRIDSVLKSIEKERLLHVQSGEDSERM